MTLLSRSLHNKKSKSIAFYIIYVAIISTLLFIGLSGNINADSVNNKQQVKKQNNPVLIKATKQRAMIVNKKQNNKKHKNNWFKDNLNHKNLKARAWVAWHESRDEWNILSYGHRCIGYFQLDPAYLGYKHGHVNLNHKHQVQVADSYAKTRYGSWVNAKKFWQAHHWY